MAAGTGIMRVKDALSQNKQAIARMMPSSMDYKRFNIILWHAINNSPSLQECNPKSVIACVAHAAQLGLEPNSALQECYLIPFNSKFGKQATLVIDYRGFIKLAHQSGFISSISAVAVYDNDDFQIFRGTEDRIHHVPNLKGHDGKPEAHMLGAYAVVTFKDGTKQFDYMSKKEIDLIRGRSKAKDDGPWVTDYVEMAKKTVMKRLLKQIPKSAELQRAVELDNSMEYGSELPAVYDADGEAVELDDNSEDPRDQGARIADQLQKEQQPADTRADLEAAEHIRLEKKFFAKVKDRLGNIDHHAIIGTEASIKTMTLDQINEVIQFIDEGQFDNLKGAKA